MNKFFTAVWTENSLSLAQLNMYSKKLDLILSSNLDCSKNKDVHQATKILLTFLSSNVQHFQTKIKVKSFDECLEDFLEQFLGRLTDHRGSYKVI